MLPDVCRSISGRIHILSIREDGGAAYQIRKDKETLSQGSFLPSACVTHDMSHVFSSPGKVWLGTCHEEAIVVITKEREREREVKAEWEGAPIFPFLFDGENRFLR